MSGGYGRSERVSEARVQLGWTLIRASAEQGVAMRTLIYKRTHPGDPDREGRFGIHGCMGRVRTWRFGGIPFAEGLVDADTDEIGAHGCSPSVH